MFELLTGRFVSVLIFSMINSVYTTSIMRNNTSDQPIKMNLLLASERDTYRCMLFLFGTVK